jgi:hypothetical protein
MKKIIVIMMAIGFFAASVSHSWAWFGAKKKAAQEETVVQPAAPAAKSQAAAVEEKQEAVKKADKAKADAEKVKKAAVERKRNELNNTEWQIELSPLSGKGKKELEAILFQSGQISFANYGKKGFPATNYTLTVQDDGSLVIETMQTSEKAGIAFWRIESDASMQNMRGVLSHQVNDKTKEDYSFASTGKKMVPPAGN